VIGPRVYKLEPGKHLNTVAPSAFSTSTEEEFYLPPAQERNNNNNNNKFIKIAP
jgi:hypothetical protein